MKQHKGVTRNRRGGILTTTLCGRMNKASNDGMNIADNDAVVTCAFCLRRMEADRKRRENDAAMRHRMRDNVSMLGI